tara:strand:+ start:838 stop:1059 length:222 start_codon:yes stop_codon:yes gene_type:complete
MFPGDAAVVTTSDTVNLREPSVIFVGTTGALRVLTAQGSDVTFAAVPGGTIVPLQVIRVYASGTTATNLVRIF